MRRLVRGAGGCVTRNANIILRITLFALLYSCSYAQEKDLTINAHSVNYDNINNIIEATGSVEALYQDFTAYGEHLIYHTDSKILYMDRGFNFKFGEVDLTGQVLTYEVKTRQGAAIQVEAAYDRVLLSGRSVKFDRSKLELKAASFNGCGLTQPHYHFTASDIVLYPKAGWLVSYWGIFYLGDLPTMPVPIYIYDVEAQRRGRGNILPYPVLGSNPDDGNYVSESLAWTQSRELFGSVTVSYLEKKGLGLGGEANYVRDELNSGNVRLAGNGQDKIWGGWTHQYSFGDEILPAEEFNFHLFNLPTFRRYSLSSNLSYRERINYERVSQLPNLTLGVKQIDWGEVKGVAELQAGLITEESTGASLARISAGVDLVRPFRLDSLGYLTPGVNLSGTYYGNHTNWRKITGRVIWDRFWGSQVMTSLGYHHYFMNIGASPFRYEQYRFNPADQISAGLIYSFALSKLGVSALYNLPKGEPQDIDYLFKIGFHCYSIGVTYRALRNEFNFSFSLN